MDLAAGSALISGYREGLSWEYSYESKTLAVDEFQKQIKIP